MNGRKDAKKNATTASARPDAAAPPTKTAKSVENETNIYNVFILADLISTYGIAARTKSRGYARSLVALAFVVVVAW